MSDVTPHHITGDWRHIIEDGMVDHDPHPDEVLPTGHVLFEPINPRVAIAGTPATAYTLGPDKALIADGLLTDMQGREGMWLAGKIGGHTVRWRATVNLEFRGQKIFYPTVEFDLTENIRLTGLVQQTGKFTPFVIDPRIEDLAGRLADVDLVVGEAEQIVEDAAQSVVDAQAQVALAAAEANRAIGLAHAQDEHIAGTLEDETSETHAAFKRVGNATYGTKAKVDSLESGKLDKTEAASTYAPLADIFDGGPLKHAEVTLDPAVDPSQDGTLLLILKPPPTQFFTDFSQDTVGQAPAGWTRRWGGDDALTITEDAGGRFLRISGGSTSSNRGLTWDSITPHADVEVVLKWRATVGFGGPKGLVRASSGAAPFGYHGGIFNSAPLGGAAESLHRLDGTPTSVTLAASLAAVEGDTWYITRMRADGATISVRTWDASVPEPSVWVHTVQDNALTDAGLVGMRLATAAGSRDIEWFGVGVNGDTAPMQAVVA